MATRLRATTVNTTHRDEHQRKLSDDCLSNPISSSTLEIILDDQSISNSGNEDSSSQDRQSCAGSTSREQYAHRRRKHATSDVSESQSAREQMDVCSSAPKKDPKSHRLIEKRRRDRMNACLSELLELTPHEIPESQRRIEKTEIIEMAIRHMRYLISKTEIKDKHSEPANLDAYRTGYRNGLADLYEYVEKHSNQTQFLRDLIEYLKQKESELANVTAIPNRKRALYSNRSDKKSKTVSTKDEDNVLVIPDVEEIRPSDSVESKRSLMETTDPVVKVPVFVLHPSGTHYIPMSIDSSIVSHVFNKNNSSSRSTSTSSTPEQVQCHPVSIPVNFNPVTSFSEPYELDIQNINVIGTRHQTSVRPN